MRSIKFISASLLVTVMSLFMFSVISVAAGAKKTYVVKKGDTLWWICQKSFKDPVYYKTIVDINQIRNPDQIFPGQKIVLPYWNEKKVESFKEYTHKNNNYTFSVSEKRRNEIKVNIKLKSKGKKKSDVLVVNNKGIVRNCNYVLISEFKKHPAYFMLPEKVREQIFRATQVPAV